ncbi:unnamed protein product, partial [Scytosiphon promiscuus]
QRAHDLSSTTSVEEADSRLPQHNQRVPRSAVSRKCLSSESGNSRARVLESGAGSEAGFQGPGTVQTRISKQRPRHKNGLSSGFGPPGSKRWRRRRRRHGLRQQRRLGPRTEGHRDDAAANNIGDSFDEPAAFAAGVSSA